MSEPAPTKDESQMWVQCRLEDGFQRGDTLIRDIRLRKPNTGELRGLNLQKLMTLDIDGLIAVLPRITDPIMIPAEVAALSPIDITILGAEFLTFFMTAEQRTMTAS